jgi:predicted Zn-dependent protease
MRHGICLRPRPVNQWIQYEGELHAGKVVLKQISFFQAAVTAGEQKLRDKTNFDASPVTEEDRQSGASKFFKGVNYKRIPASHDSALQARVDNIGERLIPKWQKDLPAGDPNKVEFQFQLVDAKWPDCITMPSGVILVPLHTVGQLEDDELAVVLADNIATALEKQTFRYLPAGKAMTASSIAGDVAGVFVPGLSLVPIAGNGMAAHTIKKHLEEQSGRVSLVLLHDAGFDIDKAPLAWWQLSAHRSDFMSRPVPFRAAYLFTQLAAEWSIGSPILRPSS